MSVMWAQERGEREQNVKGDLLDTSHQGQSGRSGDGVRGSASQVKSSGLERPLKTVNRSACRGAWFRAAPARPRNHRVFRASFVKKGVASSERAELPVTRSIQAQPTWSGHWRRD